MRNANKPAFQKSIIPLPDGSSENGFGLTKREYFAAMAMQSIIPSYMSKPVSLNDTDSVQRLVSQWAIKFADELLKRLEE